MYIPSLERMRELAGLPVLKEGSSFNNPIDDSTEEDLWKYLLWALAQTTKDPSKTIKDLLKKGLKLSDSSVVDSIAGTNVSKQITEHLQLWQKLQTSKQKLLVSFKLLEKSLGHLYDEKEPLEEVNSIIAARQALKEKNRLLGLALNKVQNDHKKLLKFIVEDNSVEWLASTLSRMGIK